jgi:hypothetical protein
MDKLLAELKSDLRLELEAQQLEPTKIEGILSYYFAQMQNSKPMPLEDCIRVCHGIKN